MSKATAIVATLLQGEDNHARSQEIPGAIYYVEWAGVPDGAMMFSCPCGCKATGGVNVRPYEGHPSFWHNRGTRELPTLQPSIGFSGDHDAPLESDGYHWHGYLKNGVWESC